MDASGNHGRESPRSALRPHSFRAGTAGPGGPAGMLPRWRAITGRARAGSSRTGLRRALRRFAAGSRGGVAIENTIAVVVLVGAFAGLMEIVSTVFESDRMGRAARAAAQAIALNPNADSCAAIRRELRFGEDFDCSAWKITVHQDVLPSELSDALEATAPAGTGEMVLVRIDWRRAPWSFGNVVPTAHAAGGDGGADGAPTPGLTSRIAIGVARREPVD